MLVIISDVYQVKYVCVGQNIKHESVFDMEAIFHWPSNRIHCLDDSITYVLFIPTPEATLGSDPTITFIHYLQALPTFIGQSDNIYDQSWIH